MNMPYEMFLTIQLMHLTCRKNRDMNQEAFIVKERASEEYKENDRSTSRNEDHLGHVKSSKMKNNMMILSKKEEVS